MKTFNFFAVLFVFLLAFSTFAEPTAEEILKGIRFRSIGPASMSGRIADIDVDPNNLWTVYVATASGGVWKTTNNGITWRPIFDDAGSGSIGDVTVSLADSNIVWVGTGENTNRNSVGWGDGVYKSLDGGNTWTNMGLAETEQIAKIIIHPKNPNVVWVAAIGPLWSASEHRGVFMTEDGGKTWTKVLYIDEHTGASDLIIDPKNPKVLYAGMYERRRFPWTFYSGGKNGGVFKSTDGGKTWKKLTNGLPKGMTGKIGLTIFPKKTNIVYAVIEAEKGSKPEEDQNGFYRSDDAGKTWKHMGMHSTRPFYYHEILVDPEDDKRLYSCSTNLMLSTDGGKTWKAMRTGVHPDWHALWINPSDPKHIWGGNDGGAFVSYDRGETWKHMSQIVASQFYAITVDMAIPYHVYGGLQDNGSWGGPSLSREREGIGNYHWYGVGGGDGFYVQVDWLDNETIYSESQNGGITRRNKRTGETRSIRPRAPEGEQYRFNWNSPIHLSPHNPRIVWFGGNKLFKSIDRGDNWRVASPDLTTNDPEKLKPMGGLTQERTGAETHCTIVSIGESRLKPGVVWIGTDDGLVHVTQNDGYEWARVSDSIPDVPANSWCSRVEPSRFKLERCYVTFDNHRRGDFKPYVFVTEDFGKTWKNISSNLPENGSVYVIREDPTNEDLLYVGTEFALFVSFDRGVSWTRWKSGLPTVAVHDIVIHPREREIVVGTHGRGIYIAPVEGLQMLNKENFSKNFVLFEPVPARRWVPWSGAGYGDGRDGFYGENPPNGARIFYYLKEDVKDVKIEILSITGEVVGTISNPPTVRGLHVVNWNMITGGEGRRRNVADPGEYAVRITVGSETQLQKLVVEPDPITQERR